MLVPMVSLFAAGCRHGHRGHFGGEMRAEEVAERFKDAAEIALDEVDATDSQRAAVKGTLDRLAADLAPLQREHRALRADLHKALTAEAIDRQELERLRRAGLDLVDRATARALDAVAQTAETLTPQQRRDLVAAWRH